MKLCSLCAAADIPCQGAPDTEITAIVTDSRHACPGCLFVCIRGLRTDGHAYIAQAIEKGAACILTDRYHPTQHIAGVTCLQCGDTRRAEAYLRHAWYRSPTERLSLIAVTGTNGKTTTAHILSHLLASCGHRVGTVGTLGASIAGTLLDIRSEDPAANMTTPDPAELYRILSVMEERGVDTVVMEASSHALELEKLAPITFDAAIFTGLSPEHLDFHGSMERYARAKAKLFTQSRITVCNADSPYAAFMASHAKGKCIMASPAGGDADICAQQVKFTPDGVHYRLRSLSTHLGLFCPLPGEFTLPNSMLAAVTALSLGCDPQTLQAALASMPPVMGRMERVELGENADITVIIDYAHTPDALEKALTSFAKAYTRLTVLFGCGGDRDRTKRPVMGEIAARLADRVILTSDNPRTEDPAVILSEIRAGIPEGTELAVILSRREAIGHAIQTARPGEVILLAGKGHETYELIGREKRPFYEREIARSAYQKRCQKEGNTP